jgi:hypothetical protein
MQEPGLRRLREGARLGLFKNKVGREYSRAKGMSKGLLAALCGAAPPPGWLPVLPVAPVGGAWAGFRRAPRPRSGLERAHGLALWIGPSRGKSWYFIAPVGGAWAGGRWALRPPSGLGHSREGPGCLAGALDWIRYFFAAKRARG